MAVSLIAYAIMVGIVTAVLLISCILHCTIMNLHLRAQEDRPLRRRGQGPNYPHLWPGASRKDLSEPKDDALQPEFSVVMPGNEMATFVAQPCTPPRGGARSGGTSSAVLSEGEEEDEEAGRVLPEKK